MCSRTRGYSWSDLPPELVEAIAESLGTSKSDVSRFRSVCASWRSSVLPFKYPISFPIIVPLLNNPNTDQEFLVLSQSTLYRLSRPSPPLSWLVKLREQQGQRQSHSLVNPLSPRPINPFPESFPRLIDTSKFRVFELAKAYALQFSDGSYCSFKVALSWNHDCSSMITLIVTAFGVLCELTIGQSGGWRILNDMTSQLSYQDVVLFEGRFCAVDEDGRVVAVDTPSLRVSEIAKPITERGGVRKSLVVSNGGLLLVDAYLKQVKRFRVYKLNSDEKRWDELQSLEDRIVFLGDDCSFSVAAQDLGWGWEGNCIVFRDKYFMVYTLENKKVSSMDEKPEYASVFYPPPLI